MLPSSNSRGLLTGTMIAAILWLLCPQTMGLITGERENRPVTDRGWPQGTVAVGNLSSRVGWWEGPPFGGGQYTFLYRGNTAAFNAALIALSQILAPERLLVVHDGPQTDFFLGSPDDPSADAQVDWTFVVWIPQSCPAKSRRWK